MGIKIYIFTRIQCQIAKYWATSAAASTCLAVTGLVHTSARIRSDASLFRWQSVEAVWHGFRKPAFTSCALRPAFLKPQWAVSQGTNPSWRGKVYRLFRVMPMVPEAFLECRACLGYGLVPRPTFKRPRPFGEYLSKEPSSKYPQFCFASKKVWFWLCNCHSKTVARAPDLRKCVPFHEWRV